MFRLLPSGLPKDPEYPTDLKQLGYFVNDEDEIRSIENPKYYFKYFINRTERYNERQRESMNTAIRTIVSERLATEGMETHLLPLGTHTAEPHIPILASTHISICPRTILLLGDSIQDLGILALRIIGGYGGINAGSCVDFVKYVHNRTFLDSGERAAVILANCGQLRWNRRQGMAMTRVSWDSLTRESAVHDAPLYEPAVNTVEGNRDQKAHISYVLSTVVPALCKEGGKLDVIAIADSARYVCEVLDENWDTLGGRMQSLACVFPFHDQEVYQDGGFKKFLLERARGYIMSDSPPGLGVFGPNGGREAWQWGYGMNVYGLPMEVAEESVFPRHFKGVVDWMNKVAGEVGYVNETVVEVDVGEIGEEVKGEGWGEELVGAEIWETEAGRRQLMGGVGGGDGAGEAEKVDVDENKKMVEGVSLGDVEAQQVKKETEKVDVDENKKMIDDAITVNVEAPQAKKEAEKPTPPPQPPTTEDRITQTLVGATAKLRLLGYDGASDEPPSSTTTSTSTSASLSSTSISSNSSTSTAIPPERMERLPSYVETDEGSPRVKLSREERAAILQITVLSSPVRGKEGAGEGVVKGDGERK
ncbi:hypothetical protein VE02_05067 [Pseudogymnoascus sp. 03VT05]|nr:hypothetical protein VE02_05067 [Pseudogymnoascus sp. 03VT05]